MKDKIFQLLKQAYKSLGLGDEVLMAHAEMLANTGIVTEDNVSIVVDSQKSFLESLQKENDRRVTDAKKKFEAEQTAKAEAEAEKKAREEAEEEAERKRLEELAKQNEVPEYFKKFLEEQAQKEKASKEAAVKAQAEYKELIESLTKSNSEQKTSYEAQMTKQSDLIKSLQDTITRQQEEAKAEKEAAAKAKAKADHEAKILSKAKELGIPQSRIDEGFTIADDADDEAISTYLSKVSNNYKTLLQPTLGGFRQVSTGEATKEEVDNIANNLVKTL